MSAAKADKTLAGAPQRLMSGFALLNPTYDRLPLAPWRRKLRAMTSSRTEPYSVSRLNLEAQGLLEGSFPLIWLQGEIALKAQDLDSAILHLRGAREAFAEHGNPFDIAAISLQLARALFVSGSVTEMRGIAAEMMSLLKPLQRHRFASSAIHEFARAALTGEVTVRLFDRICFQLENGRTSIRGTQIQN